MLKIKQRRKLYLVHTRLLTIHVIVDYVANFPMKRVYYCGQNADPHHMDHLVLRVPQHWASHVIRLKMRYIKICIHNGMVCSNQISKNINV